MKNFSAVRGLISTAYPTSIGFSQYVARFPEASKPILGYSCVRTPSGRNYQSSITPPISPFAHHSTSLLDMLSLSHWRVGLP